MSQVITFDAVPWPPPQCCPARPESAAAAIIEAVSAGLSAEERRKVTRAWCRRWHPVRGRSLVTAAVTAVLSPEIRVIQATRRCARAATGDEAREPGREPGREG
jgi:hypothetical protein